MKLINEYLAQAFLIRNSGRNWDSLAGRKFEKPLVGFEDETEIPHARLAHFPAQIGHWRISSRETNHNR